MRCSDTGERRELWGWTISAGGTTRSGISRLFVISSEGPPSSLAIEGHFAFKPSTEGYNGPWTSEADDLI